MILKTLVNLVLPLLFLTSILVAGLNVSFTLLMMTDDFAVGMGVLVGVCIPAAYAQLGLVVIRRYVNLFRS